MTVFSAVFTAVAISAAQDLFELVAPSDSRVRLLEIDLAQYSDFADAEAVRYCRSTSSVVTRSRALAGPA